MICERCKEAEATTHQQYRNEGDDPSWVDHETERCDKCAQALRDYAALGGISLYITVDRKSRKR